ncbi:MAG: outer membrane protein assembly factor BamB [Glaciecola sp.]|jgi:outer membrane protein assembly factor BamB
MGRRGRTGTLDPARPAGRFAWLTGRASRREIVCPTCQSSNDAAVAKWCGHCGERLQPYLTAAVARTPMAGPDLRRIRAIAVPTFAVIVVLALAIPAALQGNGAVARGQSTRADGMRSGVLSTAAPAAPSEVVWEAQTRTPGLPDGALRASGVFATVVNNDQFEVLDLATGRVVRTVDLATTSLDLASSRSVNGLVLVASDTFTELQAFEPESGLARWTTPVSTTSPQIAAGALALGESIITQVGTSRLIRLSVNDGAVQWETDVAGALGVGVVRTLGTSPGWTTAVTVAPAGADLRAGSDVVTGGLVGVASSSGQVNWSVSLTADEALAPIAVSSASSPGEGWIVHAAFARGPNPLIVVRSRATGREQTTFPVAGTVLDLAIVGDVAVISSDVGGVVAFDAASGEELWALDVPAGPLTAVDSAGSFLIQSPEDDTLTVVTSAGVLGAEMRRVSPDIRPAVVGDVIAITTSTGEVAVRDLRGSVLWDRVLAVANVAALATDGDLVAINTESGTTVLDGRTGVQRTSVERRTDGIGYGVSGSVAISAGVVVASPMAATQNGQGLAAIRAETGIATWNMDGSQPPAIGPITLADGRAWVPVGQEIHGYDLLTGRRAYAELAGADRGPLVVTSMSIIATIAGPRCAGLERCPQSVVALSRGDRPAAGVPRDLQWSSDLPVCGPAAADDQRLLVPTSTGPAALDVLTGATLWRTTVRAPSCRPIAVAKRSAVQAGGTSVTAWSLDDGTQTWSVEIGETMATDPVIAGNEVVVATSDGNLIALDLATGDVLWQYRLPEPALVDPVIVGERWVILLRDGRVVGLR